MSASSLLAGIALANARLGIVHGLAHPLGVRLGLPHGLLCGVLLPFAVELNRDAAREKYQVLARLTGMDASNASLYDGASALAEARALPSGETRRILVHGGAYYNTEIGRAHV
jgi:alcohol dehydrogenase class IV